MYAVIMAGGRGTRFWPLSREKKPKHLLNITDEKTIIQKTVERIRPLIPETNIYVITGANHCEEVKYQCSNIPEENIIAEPVGRNTAPCIGLAAVKIKKMDPHAVMVVLPADHLITNEDLFLNTLTTAGEMAQKGNYLITIGIKPTGPETGYGYIEEGEPVSSIGGNDIYKVKSFREKPDITQAEKFIKDGKFFWNSGTFIWTVSTILDAIKNLLPDLYEGLLKIESSLDTENEEDVLRRVYEDIKPVSIDYGVMEKADGALLVKGTFGWSDIGSWDALYDVLSKDEKGNSLRGPVITIDSSNSLIYSPHKLVTLVGVENLIVVETEDSLLICNRGCSQDVKKVVDMLEEKEMKEYL